MSFDPVSTVVATTIADSGVEQLKNRLQPIMNHISVSLNDHEDRLERIEAMLAKIVPSTKIAEPQKQGMVAQPQQTQVTEHAR